MRRTIITFLLATFVVATYGNLHADCGSSHGSDMKEANAKAAQLPELQGIVETAIAAGTFNTLVTAVQTAGLDKVLAGEGPFTVFAPTDEAFAALPEGTVEALLKDKDALKAVLTYHVVAGDYPATQVVGRESLQTVNGQNLGIRTEKDGVMVGNAQVIKTDIRCANGVIHVIDKVVLPAKES